MSISLKVNTNVKISNIPDIVSHEHRCCSCRSVIIDEMSLCSVKHKAELILMYLFDIILINERGCDSAMLQTQSGSHYTCCNLL